MELNHTLFYILLEEVNNPDGKVEKPTMREEEGKALTRGPPPRIDNSTEYRRGEEKSEMKEIRSRRKAARSIY